MIASILFAYIATIKKLFCLFYFFRIVYSIMQVVVNAYITFVNLRNFLILIVRNNKELCYWYKLKLFYLQSNKLLQIVIIIKTIYFFLLIFILIQVFSIRFNKQYIDKYIIYNILLSKHNSKYIELKYCYLCF